MGEKVVSLRGTPIDQPGAPNPAVIALAQDALDRAKSGDLQGLAVIYHYSDESFGHGRCCDNTFGILGAIERLKHAILHE